MSIVRLEKVGFTRDKKRLLNDISWSIQKDQHWAILGLNGAGKTLLLQIICGYLWPSDGTVEVLGQTFGKSSIPDLQRRIGWISTALQYRIRGNETAEKIVLSGKFASIGIYQKYTDSELNRAKGILAQVGGEHLIGKKYDVLSQGERQLILIARGLMTEPELLILDEPCNGLDLFAREKLLKQIEGIAQSTVSPTIVYVTHHTEEILPCFENLLLLKDGQITAKGQRENLFTEEILTNFYSESIQLLPLKKDRFAVYPK
ncbi:ABC transporter ATP-binding protein [Enterococcus sp. BWB1-3]|uniref:ABC transporter ATP-binding protein n=1 Tax=unclassified Enterococcus TaxID=2608891 RepID=UPI001922B91D|nr:MULTISPECIES: ABC transporter ATP-binding protein [unclassified Enterococcus]MBL1229410.1 ABC transporter ATP-binding protein [Enterococcus sp. BWB1-3]MCB5952581.1 ABC transporter ATP-binding protein [Enterococcus sp. BWT-B8]MCB5956459.1 ABC transporter ATP-binding protein [Enterococcus sp. CWB-B31]